VLIRPFYPQPRALSNKKGPAAIDEAEKSAYRVFLEGTCSASWQMPFVYGLLLVYSYEKQCQSSVNVQRIIPVHLLQDISSFMNQKTAIVAAVTLFF